MTFWKHSIVVWKNFGPSFFRPFDTGTNFLNEHKVGQYLLKVTNENTE